MDKIFTYTDKYGKIRKIEFQWDPVKEFFNIKKHGLSFSDAVEAFKDPDGFSLKDENHSKNETRRYWIGKIRDRRVATVRFTIRANLIRVFGVAEWRYFRRMYNEKTKHKKS